MIGLAILAAFLALVAAGAIYIGQGLTYEGYWLNNRRTSLFLLVATIVATQVGAGTTLGIASSTAQAGTGYWLVAIVTTGAGFLLIPAFVPRIMRVAQRAGEFTLTGLYRYRFGRATGLVSALVVVLGYLGFIAGQFVAGAALVDALTPLNWGQAIALSAVTVVVYSAFAGLKGDFMTDGFLFVFMLILLLLTGYVLFALASEHRGLMAEISAATWSPIRFGGYTYLIGGLAIGALIPLISLEMWLRVFAADEAAIAKKAFWWSAFLLLPFYTMPMLAGAVATVAVPSAVASQTVLVDVLATQVSPVVMVVVYLGLVATIISTTNTLQIILGAVIHRDILPRRRESVPVSRGVTAVVGLVAAAFAYFVRDIVDLILAGFFLIVLLGPLFLDLVIRPDAEPNETGDWVTAGAVVAGVLLTIVGFPFAGVGAVLVGFVVVATALVGYRVLQSQMPRGGGS